MVLNKKTNQISVREICEATGINRSSFYLHYAGIPALITAIVEEKWMGSVERIHEEMHGDPNIFSEAYVAATLREAKRDRAFYRAYFEKFGTAEVEKGYQTLFENVFKPFFRRLGLESDHCMEYHFEFVKAGVLCRDAQVAFVRLPGNAGRNGEDHKKKYGGDTR